MHIKTGDKVQVIKGKDRGKVGKVLVALPKKNRVIVEGVNVQIKHQKPTSATQQGGIVEREGAIDASNVLLYDEKLGRGVRTRTEVQDGKKVRVSTKSGEKLDK
ncbi:50S ribosomal protein L24 [Helcococcus kunzii]|uniref:Large ribosomal subunit protein uL24 n=1 Tax=Helcococcus kunzii ATCC 51366 TaxID=883114 RepID=H3NP57_9FIRM|nr:50S ribosomal protein L24 [Helcococcus kunzii]EHR33519.1 ribosomal protein L24 [Helcococcus kunzii ATCC 51366]MCT1795781.1 50S ribosomal protein L24 [Helcococcus kunzii]MCT1989360.1 50S ribosomal protein L24 [Helcococcus kunzii]QUY65023.1 50S ribosomal protein L24 [Helcococcus kunzii]QZO75730.1 50S ribosomal protein L24 [Helcococcus kunzii]